MQYVIGFSHITVQNLIDLINSWWITIEQLKIPAELLDYFL